MLIFIPILTIAQEANEYSTFGGWSFVEANHDFSKSRLYLTAYIEHDNYDFNKLECVYGRFSVGWKPLKWFSFGVNYIFLYGPIKWYQYVEADVVGTLQSGNFKTSIRERYRHCFTTGSNELRSRLKVAYRIKDTKVQPYLAVEVFTWGVNWLKTRYYVACCYDITDFMQIEGYYLYYVFKKIPAEHILGLGLNFKF